MKALLLAGRIVASIASGILLFLLAGWLIDKATALTPRDSPMHKGLEWLLAMFSPMLFGSLIVLLLVVLSYFLLGRVFHKP